MESVRMVLIDNWSSLVSVIGSATVVTLIGVSSSVGVPGRPPCSGGARGVAELGGQERLHEIPGHAWTHRAATDADDVHVVVLDALPSGKVVMDQRGTNGRHLVGADRGAHAAAAERHPPS